MEVIQGLKVGESTVFLPIAVDEIGRLVVVVGAGGLPVVVQGSGRTCVGRQTLNVTTGAVVTLAPPAGAVAAMIQADGSAVSMTLDGTAPTATIGTRIDDGGIMNIDSVLSAVRLIARSATTNVQVAYFDKA
jgi:hypothetical protein